MQKLLKFTKQGIYCPPADLYIDPNSSVNKAVITHAHSDHARKGSKKYLAHKLTVPLLKYRLGNNINIDGIEYGKETIINGVNISLHPAGHIPGSAQVRLEYRGEIAVISGDYKLQNDGFTEPFELIRCNTFITESTFGLPVYKWEKQSAIFTEINKWWQRNRDKGIVSVICGYSLGKAQRILFKIDKNIGKIFGHKAILEVNEILINNGKKLPGIEEVKHSMTRKDFEGALIISPPSVAGSSWLKKLEPCSIANASGWMKIRAFNKRRQSFDAGFALSDHADWNELNAAAIGTGAEEIFVTHGFCSAFARWLRHNGLNANELYSEYKTKLQ